MMTRRHEPRQTSPCGQRHRFVTVSWSAVLVMMMAAVIPTVFSYGLDRIPKVAKPQAFSTSRTQLREKKETVQHEQSFTARPPKKRSSKSKVAMTSTVIDHATVPTFERRMRDMVLGQPRRETRTRARNLPSNVKMVQTLDDYKTIVGGERDRIVVARFYAPWCKACKAMQPVYYKLANKFSGVLFVEVPVTDENAALHQGLGVPSLPYGHIYYPNGGLVEELGISRKAIGQFGSMLQSYVRGSCELKDMSPDSPYVQTSAQSSDQDNV